MITQNEFSAHYIGCFFQYCFFLEKEGAGIISSVLQENASEIELDAVNEGTDLLLKRRENDTKF
jgi:hypothetical protein